MRTWIVLAVAASGCSDAEVAPGTHQLPVAPDMSGLNVPATAGCCCFCALPCSALPRLMAGK